MSNSSDPYLTEGLTEHEGREGVSTGLENRVLSFHSPALTLLLLTGYPDQKRWDHISPKSIQRGLSVISLS